MDVTKKWTPGPWDPETYPHGGFDIAALGAGRLGGTLIIVSRNPHSDVEAMHANAHLIAAAPEMYEALDALLIGMEASGGWAGDDGLFDAGMAALRKARGEA